MEGINIPKRRRFGLSLIRRLSADAAREICLLLETDVVGASSEAQALKPTSSFSSLSSEEIESLVSAVAELYRVRASRNAPIDEFANTVTEAMTDIEEEHRVPDSESEEFKEKLKIVLGAEQLSLTSKANSLALQDERVFCNARIMTELRPVFADDSDARPRAMVLVHRLKIQYHAGSSEHKDIYLALDRGDLQDLQKAIIRAEEEAKSLDAFLPDIRLFRMGETDEK